MGRQVLDKAESQVVEPTALATRPENNGLATTPDLGPNPSIRAVIAHALSLGSSVEVVERLVALEERVSAKEAKQAFDAAMAAFKEACPPIPRRTVNAQFKVKKVDHNGVAYEEARRYASLEDIEETVRGPLGKHGLSYRWGEAIIKDGMLSITCIVAHVGGHREPAVASYPVTSNAGCSEQQKYRAARTYARLDSLVDVLGITTCTDDEAGNVPPPKAAVISEHQVANLKALCDEVGADRPKFMEWLGVNSLEHVTTAQFPDAIAALEKKRRKA